MLVEGKSGRIRIAMSAQLLGRDVNVSVFGGELPHIGAVALAQARESLKADGSISASCSVLTLCGHKEDEAARLIASFLARELNANVCVACGIHQDDISGAEISLVGNLLDELMRELAERLKGEGPDRAGPGRAWPVKSGER